MVEDTFSAADSMRNLEQTFSRGLSTGWLEGTNPHGLVSGDVTSHRGTRLGQEGQRSFHHVKRYCLTGRVVKCPLLPLSQGFHFPQSSNDVRFDEFLFDTP